jgi:hypothetical protein
MKKVLILSAVIAASLIATKSYSQVYVNAHVGFRIPGPRVYVAPAPVYAAPVYDQPEYQQPAYDQPAYGGGYYAAPQVCETEYPGYVYYNYPAWNGHYRDRYYFAHYRPFFERDHRAYFAGNRFDHARWGHDHGNGGRGWARPGSGHRW